MKNHTKFFGKQHRITWMHKFFSRTAKNGVIHVAMMSNFFCELPDNFFCTNSMYSDLKDSIITSIDIYRTDAEIVLDLFESEPSLDEKREIAIIGFRKYIEACHDKLWKQLLSQLTTVSIFALYGISIQFLLYEVSPNWPQWILNCVDISGWVTIWQFVGFWAFEYAGQRREIKRLKQILNLKFHFKEWE